MDFEFDPAKSAANKAKYGIDFVEARFLIVGRRMWVGSEHAVRDAKSNA